MSKHTPGPWSICSAEPFLFGKKQGEGIGPIGFVYGPSFAERSELGQEAMANARLIAAAPDLLKALQMAFELLQSVPDDYAMPDHPVWGKCRAAIAKATGEQP